MFTWQGYMVMIILGWTMGTVRNKRPKWGIKLMYSYIDKVNYELSVSNMANIANSFVLHKLQLVNYKSALWWKCSNLRAS